MLSLFVEELDNGLMVKVQANTIEPSDGPKGRFYATEAELAEGLPALVLDAIAGAKEAAAEYRRRHEAIGSRLGSVQATNFTHGY